MSAHEPVRVGLVGAGAMGAVHAESLLKWVPGAKLVRLYDPDSDRARQLADAAGARTAKTAEELINDSDVQAVILAAPDPMHQELAIACLTAGKPTLLEKPLATSVAGSLRVLESEIAVGRRLLQIGFMRRFDAAFCDLRSAILGGEIGQVRAAHCIHRNVEAHPAATSEGVLLNSAIHEFDCVPWLLDDRVAAVTVFAPKVTQGHLRDVQIAVLEMGAGAVVTVEVAVNARYGYDIHTEVVGNAGTASLTAPYGLSLRRDGLQGRLLARDFGSRFADAYRTEVSAWVHGVRAGHPPDPSTWDGYLANLTAAAAVASLRTGARVEVPQESKPPLYIPSELG